MAATPNFTLTISEKIDGESQGAFDLMDALRCGAKDENFSIQFDPNHPEGTRITVHGATATDVLKGARRFFQRKLEDVRLEGEISAGENDAFDWSTR